MQAADLVNAGVLELAPLITSRYPLSEAVQAFEAAEEGINMRVSLVL